MIEWLTTTRDYVTARLKPPAGVSIPDDVSNPRMAIIPMDQNTLTDADYHVAEWDPDVANTVRLLAGRETLITLTTPGLFKVYVRLDNNAAEPDIFAGQMRVRRP